MNYNQKTISNKYTKTYWIKGHSPRNSNISLIIVFLGIFSAPYSFVFILSHGVEQYLTTLLFKCCSAAWCCATWRIDNISNDQLNNSTECDDNDVFHVLPCSPDVINLHRLYPVPWCWVRVEGERKARKVTERSIMRGGRFAWHH